ncbi:MmpS family transport accessory protein [Arthrobacter zhaoxinii]|uniref:MmpS family transport accessory protein n=1 Tax=Arthrobacter zhaoxinii TaxID=2964616 RepID=UPI002104E593|nr:MmpS family transport accessory protein [Arthrobacter zhaoxinii]MCQ2001154.1 MmpS family protein [Arthrobacter zhaoxinii]
MKRKLAATAVLLLAASLTGCGGGDEPADAQEPASEEAKTHTILFEVSSDSPTSPSVIVSGKVGANEDEQLTDVALPFTRELTDKNETEYESFYDVSATKDESATSITCKITVDGEVMEEQTSTGAESAYCAVTPDL